MPGKVHSTTRLFMFLNLTHLISIQGFLSPANRGALMTMAMILFVLLGTPAGYVSARIYKSFGGLKWKSNVILTALFSPGIVFVLFFIMNLVLWYEESSGAVPFSTLLAILALWYVFIFIWSRQILNESFVFFTYPIQVWRECAAYIRWRIFRIQKTIPRTSRENESDTATNSWANNLHTAYSWNHNGRCLAVRMHIYSALRKS